jgi:signal transduction histidine kinase
MGTTSDGLLLRVRGETLSDETINVMREPKHIRCLQVTEDGSLWFGFAGQGLGRLKNGRFFQFRSAHGLWDEFISHILSDDQGRLWLAGNRGLFQLAQAELAAVAEGRESRVRSAVFGRGDGLANLQATFGVCPAATPTRDGRLLMPMLTGLVVVEPHRFRKISLPPPVVIERLTVNGRIAAAYDNPSRTASTGEPAPANPRIAPTRLRLGPGVNRMELEFTGLSLTSPENVMFRYQLEGLDQDWVEAGTVRVARYPRIPPGEYRFRVTACNRDGVWNEQGAAVALKVAPHLWEATWFRVAAAGCAFGVLGGGVLLAVRRRYRRQLERLEQQQALERERTRIAQDLHDDLGAGLVEINFGSELAQDPALDPEEVREHTREIGARAREMVTALDEIVWAVNPKHDSVSSLATYFCQFAQHFLKPTPVRCHLAVARELPPAPLNAEQRHSLFLAFKEALSNVVQHAGATDLRLTIFATDGLLTVSVSDNGGGLKPEAERDQNGADGLTNMRHRLQQLGGRCDVTSRPGAGTTVTFNVPLQRARDVTAG